MKIGIGYDIHRFKKGNFIFLGGIKIPFKKAVEAHSDGDVLIHAICDAILGALAENDIGMLFPDTETRYKDISSVFLLKQVIDILDKNKYYINNLDCVIIVEQLKISFYKKTIINNLSNILNVKKGCINIKGKTMEGIGEIGKNKAIASWVVVLLEKKL